MRDMFAFTTFASDYTQPTPLRATESQKQESQGATMTPTLNITIQRPSDLVIQTLKVLAKDIQFAELADAQRQIAIALLNNKSGLVWEEGSSKLDYTVGLTDPGRSVLAAYDAEAGGDGGRVEALKDTCVELVRVTLGKRPLMPESSWMDIAYRTINALDAATDKAGEKP